MQREKKSWLYTSEKKNSVLYDKTVKGYKEKDAVSNAWERTAKKLDFIENGKI